MEFIKISDTDIDLTSYLMGRNSAGGNSGGGDSGGGSANGVNIVRYAYGMPAYNEAGIVKVSDLTPSWQELDKSGFLIESRWGSEAFAFHLRSSRHLQFVTDGLLVIGEDADLENENPLWHFMVVSNEEIGELMFGMPIEKGIYFCGTLPGMPIGERIDEDYRAYLIWEPAEVTANAD